jgi:peptidyl-prolyl cis-trans isomerase SurA
MDILQKSISWHPIHLKRHPDDIMLHQIAFVLFGRQVLSVFICVHLWHCSRLQKAGCARAAALQTLPLDVRARVAYHRAPVKTFLRACLLIAGALLLQNLPARAELITAVAVVVNDSVITLGEIRDLVSQAAQTVAAKYGSDRAGFDLELTKLHDEAVEGMVEDKLVLHAFAISGYVTNVLEAFIDDDIQRTIKERYYGDRARLIQSLHAKGQTYEMFRRQQREQIIIEFMKQQNISNPHKILISPLKIEQYYQAHRDEFKMDDQVKLRMIFLPQPSDSPPGAVKKLGEEILAKIDAGVPFEEMASVYSAGSHRSEGGDRGWVDRTYFKPSLATVAFSLKPGQHSGVLEEPEGCYLLMVEDTKPAHVKEMKEVRDDIERTLRNNENLRLRQLWIDRLKRKSYINYY